MLNWTYHSIYRAFKKGCGQTRKVQIEDKEKEIPIWVTRHLGQRHEKVYSHPLAVVWILWLLPSFTHRAQYLRLCRGVVSFTFQSWLPSVQYPVNHPQYEQNKCKALFRQLEQTLFPKTGNYPENRPMKDLHSCVKAKQLCTQWKGKLLFSPPSCRCLYICQKQIVLPKLEGEKHWAPILDCNQGGPTQIQETLHTDPTFRLGAWIQKNSKDTLPMSRSVLPAALPSQRHHAILKVT